MKLKNKKTGEIVDLVEGHICETNCGSCLTVSPVAVLDKSYNYSSLAELNEEWEDYEEPKKAFYLTAWGEVKEYSEELFNLNHKLEIGNYFDTREEAEKAVEKLKAWKRLKDKGFRFDGWEDTNGGVNNIWFTIPEDKWETDVCDDLNLLFNGGEE